ncbi:MAG: radical SAM protein [Halocynthiibacter sp.]
MKDAAKANDGKFINPLVTADGSTRASVPLSHPETLWFNTGTLCNIECVNCYILSSPTNDALLYLSADEVETYLDQLEERKWNVREIGFTGGEPFMNPDIIDMLRASLKRGYDVLVLTNAMRPMMRKSMKAGIEALEHEFPGKMTFRVSLDHHHAAEHDSIRGKGTFDVTIDGMAWLAHTGIRMAAAGRMLWDETESQARAGYEALYQTHRFDIDAHNPGMTVLFPEMDENVEVPEITTDCWGILNKDPKDVMCASSRMVVKHKGAQRPSVIACTLLPYEAEFDMGETLKEAEGDVRLNHPHCAKFCVLGGASCSA